MAAAAPTREFNKLPDFVTQGLQGTNNNIQSQISSLTPQFQSAAQRVAAATPQFQRPNFGGQLDSLSQNLLAQNTQQRAAQLGSTQQQIARQFAGNPAVMRALQAQAGIQNQLGGNPALFQAGVAQRQRQAQENSAINNVIGQQSAANINAITQPLQLQTAPLQLQQGLLGTLSQLASLLGERRAETYSRGPINPQTGVPVNG